MKKDLAIIWMSAGNSYFNHFTISNLLEFTDKKFSQTKILSPFEPTIYNFLGLKYEENRAKRKAKMSTNRLKNIAQKHSKSSSNIISWKEEIIHNKYFLEQQKYIYKLFSENREFEKDALETTLNMLKRRSKDDLFDEKIAVKYLLDELSFVISSAKIFSANNVTYVYHRPWNIFEKLIAGKYDYERKEIDFLLKKFEDLSPQSFAQK